MLQFSEGARKIINLPQNKFISLWTNEVCHRLDRRIWSIYPKRNSQKQRVLRLTRSRGSRAVKGGGLKILCVKLRRFESCPRHFIFTFFCYRNPAINHLLLFQIISSNEPSKSHRPEVQMYHRACGVNKHLQPLILIQRHP